MSGYRELKVWHRAMELVVECYRLADRLPASERFGLAGQLRRASVSVPANIAEGRGRKNTAELVHFLSVASGSLAEVETLIEVAVRVRYVERTEIAPLLEHSAEIGRMLTGLRRSLQAKLRDNPNR